MLRIRKRAWFFFFLLAIFFVVAGAMTNLLLAGDLNQENRGIFEAFNLFGNGKERTNILVFGVDASNTDNVEKKRSDSIMLVSIDAAGEDPVVLSIPRDTMVDIPGRSNPDKVNHAHAYGGPELLVESVEGLTGLTIDYYVRINYKSVSEVIDTLGGIEIDVSMDMKYYDPYDDPPLRINISKGLQVLDGENAVHFLRYRKGYVDQDLGRIQAQQQFVEALKDKVLTPAIIPKIPELIGIFYDNVHTDIPQTKMLSLGTKIAGIKTDEMTKLTLPGSSKYVNDISYYIADDEAMFQIKNSYLVPESQKIYRVKVLNGCGVIGIAAEYETKLVNEGIDVSEVGNFDENTVELSYIEYLPGFEKQAQKVAKLLAVQETVQVESIDGGELQLIIGSDLAQSEN